MSSSDRPVSGSGSRNDSASASTPSRSADGWLPRLCTWSTTKRATRSVRARNDSGLGSSGSPTTLLEVPGEERVHLAARLARERRVEAVEGVPAGRRFVDLVLELLAGGLQGVDQVLDLHHVHVL